MNSQIPSRQASDHRRSFDMPAQRAPTVTRAKPARPAGTSNRMCVLRHPHSTIPSTVWRASTPNTRRTMLPAESGPGRSRRHHGPRGRRLRRLTVTRAGPLASRGAGAYPWKTRAKWAARPATHPSGSGRRPQRVRAAGGPRRRSALHSPRARVQAPVDGFWLALLGRHRVARVAILVWATALRPGSSASQPGVVLARQWLSEKGHVRPTVSLSPAVAPRRTGPRTRAAVRAMAARSKDFLGLGSAIRATSRA